MKWVAVAVLGVVLVGCGPKSGAVDADQAAKDAGLRRDQYSKDAKGEQVVTSADGTTTAMLEKVDYSTFGLGVYDGVGEKSGNAYRKTAGDTNTVYYTLTSDDASAKVIEFYEGELKSKAASGGDVGTIISGKVGEKSAVVTVIDQGEAGSKIEVQIIEETKG